MRNLKTSHNRHSTTHKAANRGFKFLLLLDVGRDLVFLLFHHILTMTDLQKKTNLLSDLLSNLSARGQSCEAARNRPPGLPTFVLPPPITYLDNLMTGFATQPIRAQIGNVQQYYPIRCSFYGGEERKTPKTLSREESRKV